jgi:hypothetical protein
LALLAAALATACSSKEEAAAPAPERSHFGSATECATCHPLHAEEWRSSSHRYAVVDPVFQAMVQLGQRETRGELKDFCVKCHTPIGNLRGETKVTYSAGDDVHRQRTSELSEEAMDGVSCLVCHSTTKVNGPSNANFDMVLDGVRRAPIRDPAPTPAHESAYSSTHKNSIICGTCHVVVNQKHVALEETYSEWVASTFNGAKSCQDCHMRSHRAPAAVGHQERTIHDHSFVGVDVSLLPPESFPGYDEMRTKTERLLKESARFEAVAVPSERRIDVAIENLAGHALPSGAVADREMWIELVVSSEDGTVVFESGTLDERGDLRTTNAAHTTRPGTDAALVLYTQVMTFDPALEDPASVEPPRSVDFLWEPNTVTNHLVGVNQTARPSYDLGALPAGHYAASLRLLFRSFPPHLLRKLEEKGGLDVAVKERVPTVEMATFVLDFTLP